jgi:hypothetical protein
MPLLWSRPSRPEIRAELCACALMTSCKCARLIAVSSFGTQFYFFKLTQDLRLGQLSLAPPDFHRDFPIVEIFLLFGSDDLAVFFPSAFQWKHKAAFASFLRMLPFSFLGSFNGKAETENQQQETSRGMGRDGFHGASH